jgi:hypothetical protein
MATPSTTERDTPGNEKLGASETPSLDLTLDGRSTHVPGLWFRRLTIP